MVSVVELNSDPWLWAFFDSAKSHVVYQEYFPDLIADLEARERPYTGHLGMGIMLLDAPGPVFVGRPLETINVNGLSLQVPCEDFAYIIELVQETHQRKFSSGNIYYKIHVWNNALVINEKQRDYLLDELNNRWELAYERGERFYDERLKNS